MDIVIGGERKDQENTTGGTSIGFGDTGSGRDYMVQGFIPTLTTITAIEFDMNAVGTEDLKIWIDTADANSSPDNGVDGIGGSTQIANADLSTSLKKFTLTTPITNLIVGNQYCIGAAPWDIGTDAWASDYRDWNSAVSNPYANGRREHLDASYANPTAPDSGNADIVFATYGETVEGITITESVTVSIETPASGLSVSVSDAITITESINREFQDKNPYNKKFVKYTPTHSFNKKLYD